MLYGAVIPSLDSGKKGDKGGGTPTGGGGDGEVIDASKPGARQRMKEYYRHRKRK